MKVHCLSLHSYYIGHYKIVRNVLYSTENYARSVPIAMFYALLTHHSSVFPNSYTSWV